MMPTPMMRTEFNYEHEKDRLEGLTTARTTAESDYEGQKGILEKAEDAKDIADRNLASSQSKVDNYKRYKWWTSKVSDLGGTSIGIGGLVAGPLSIFNATRQAGDKTQRNLAIFSGAYTTFNGILDFADGIVPLLGKGNVKIIGTGLRLGPVIGLLDAGVTIVGAGLGFALTIYDIVKHFQKEHETAVHTTKDLDRSLLQFGISGGSQTPRDDFDTTALADPLDEPPNPTAPGNAPPPANGPRLA